jgi:hypothetical protein
MQVGDLVIGTTNELMGIITDVSSAWKIHVIVYWFDLEKHSTGWVRTDGLELLCK